MAENTWLRLERDYFVETESSKLEIPEKKLNKALEKYNKYIQRALLGDSPYIAEDLKLTILKHRNNGSIRADHPSDT